MKSTLRTIFTFLLPALLATVIFAQKDEKPLDPVYNAVKDETTFFLSPVIGVDAGLGELATVNSNPDSMDSASDELSPMVVYSRFKGKTFTKPERVTIAFKIGSYRNFRFNDDRDISVKADGVETKLEKWR